MENWQLIKKESDPHVLMWNRCQWRCEIDVSDAGYRVQNAPSLASKGGQERRTCMSHTSDWKLEMCLGDTILYFPHTQWALLRPLGSPQRCLWCREDRTGLSARIPGSSTGFALTSFIHLAWVAFVGFQKWVQGRWWQEMNESICVI